MKHLYEYLEFDELSPEAQETAIENVRNAKYSGDYGGHDIGEWVIDDDSLFEPEEAEMEKLFGEDYYEANGNRYMIENTRDRISYIGKQDPNYFINCKNAIDVTNDNLFLRWLGIPSGFRKYTYYTFVDPNKGDTRIEFEIDDQDSMIEEYGEDSIETLEKHFETAEKKFANHIDWVLSKISSSIDSEFEDSSILDAIDSNNIKFEEDGEISQE